MKKLVEFLNVKRPLLIKFSFITHLPTGKAKLQGCISYAYIVDRILLERKTIVCSMILLTGHYQKLAIAIEPLKHSGTCLNLHLPEFGSWLICKEHIPGVEETTVHPVTINREHSRFRFVANLNSQVIDMARE